MTDLKSVAMPLANSSKTQSCMIKIAESFLTNLKDGRGEAWAGHNKDREFFSRLMKDRVRVSWENLGTADPIGSVVGWQMIQRLALNT